MIINLAALRRSADSGVRFALEKTFAADWPEREGCYLSAPVTVALDVRNTGKSLAVSARAETELLVTCDLCLAETAQPFRFEFADEWLTAEQAAAAGPELTEAAFVFVKDEADISERIREFFILHLPMRFVCREDCRGLCPGCGANLNEGDCACRRQETDPRLEALRRLLPE
jgi:uncharacterized protein